MCGVIGYWPEAPEAGASQAFVRLFEESRVRGRHAYGMSTGDVCVRSLDYRDVVGVFDPSRQVIAHTRYSTSGDWRVLANNQPIVADHLALVFNGVIHMGTKEEFERDFGVSCHTDNDGEVFLQRLLAGEDAEHFVRRIGGSFAGVWVDGQRMYACRNEGRPLWRASAYGAMWYASTRDIFGRAGFPPSTITQLPPYRVEILG